MELYAIRSHCDFRCRTSHLIINIKQVKKNQTTTKTALQLNAMNWMWEKEFPNGAFVTIAIFIQ